MKNKLVSIILPVYNSQDYIQDTIESVLAQTYSNFEIIVVNDGSIDETSSICKKLASKDNRIKYFYKENSGVSNTRNFALQKTSGEYITFIDSDDLYEENYLEILVNNMEKNDADIVSCAYKTLNNNCKIIAYEEEYFDGNFEEYIEKLQPFLLFNQLWNKIYKLDIIKNNHLIFDNSIDLGEDYKFNIDYMEHCNRMIYINIPLYKYRISNTGLGFKYRKNSSTIKFQLLKCLENVYKRRNYNLNYIYKNYLIQYLAFFSNVVDKRNDDSKKNKFIKISEFINSSEYRNKIKLIKKSTNIKYKFICYILLVNNRYFIYKLGKLANLYDKYKKKKRYF